MTDKNNRQAPPPKPPRLLIWSREIIFLGSCLNRQESHRSTQEILVVCLEGELSIRLTDGKRVSSRSCLIPAGLWVDRSMIETRNAVVGIYFLAPFSQDHAVLASLMTPVGMGIFCHHPDEAAAIAAMTAVRDHAEPDLTQARTAIRDALIPRPLHGLTFREYDARALAVARRIRADLHNAPSLAELAEDVSLSESRLEKLFKEQTGLPITRYRVRYRVFISTILMALGYSITEAALLAGFSNSAHLSRCYRQVNGVTPSSTFLHPPYLHSILDTSATDLVEPLISGQPVA